MKWPWQKEDDEGRTRRERIAYLNTLSNDELRRLQSEQYRQREEPRLRKEAQEAGDADWETASYITLLRRSLDRYRLARAREDARALGIPYKDTEDSWTLSGRVLSERVRRNNIQDLA